MSPLERSARTVLVWGLTGTAAAPPLLAVPRPDDPLVLVLIHLVALVGFGAAFADRLAARTEVAWFGGRSGWLLTATWIVVLTSGVVGLVTLATSAALRYDPSLQFLQALSALDIAWAGAALIVGVWWWRGRGAAVAAVAVLIAVCVWSIWRYLDIVGFGPDGSWIVDGARLRELVLPYDMAAAAIALVAVTLGVRTRIRRAG